MKRQTTRPWIWVIVIAIALDQVTKWLAVMYLPFNQPLPVLPFLNMTLRYNAGSAYGFLSQASGWQVYFFSAMAIGMSLVLFVWLMRSPRVLWCRCLGLSLIIGGAIGNLIDRIRLSYVIDFVDFHVGTWHFATFNVADSAVSVGAFFLILSVLFFEKKDEVLPDR